MKNREEKHLFKKKTSLLNETLILLVSKPIKKKKKKSTEPKLLNGSLYMHFNTSLYLIYLQLYLGKDCCFDLF